MNDKKMEKKNKKVLVAYGTRFGSTEEISQEIAKVLEQKGIESHLINLGKTKSKKWPSLEEFDGILVGSSIKITRWVKEPRVFLKKHVDEFKKREKILGVFVSGALTVVDYEKQIEDSIKNKILEELGIHADIYDAFGPLMDFSEDSKVGRINKSLLKLAAKGISNETGIEFNFEGRNDLRDWDKIRNFAEKFAMLLKD